MAYREPKGCLNIGNIVKVVTKGFYMFIAKCTGIISCVVEIVGMYWGDEGKGRIASYEAKDAKLVLRTTGGNNAGHTVYKDGHKIPLHLIPGGIIYPGVVGMICRGVVVDMEVLKDEIILLRNYIDISPDNFKISALANIILSIQKEMDAYQEEQRKDAKIGTTKRGIGPTYEDICRRDGIQFRDLFLSRKKLQKKVERLYESNKAAFEGKEFDLKKIMDELEAYRVAYGKYIVDEEELIWSYIKKGEKIVIEGAQAQHLDNFGADYPYCTSSQCNPAGTLSGAWIGPKYVKKVIGCMKAYCSRVGDGPFPTELLGHEGDVIRELGHEYGTTTGRPRRCGWLDLTAICKTAGYTDLCLNHLDTIGEIGRRLGYIKVCVGYKIDGKMYYTYPYNIIEEADKIVPKYKVLRGGFIIPEGCDTFEKLPKKAKSLVKFIEDNTGIPVTYIGIGPNNEDTIVRTRNYRMLFKRIANFFKKTA